MGVHASMDRDKKIIHSGQTKHANASDSTKKNVGLGRKMRSKLLQKRLNSISSIQNLQEV
jgi:hypothetical protein